MEKDKKQITDWVVKIVLIIIIVILLLHNCALVKGKNNEKVPTGNVDIIEIICNKDNTCNRDDDIIINPDTGNRDNGNTAPVNGNENNPSTGNDDNNDDDDDTDDLIVVDRQITWSGETNAKIFSNSMYEFEDIIAPESSNTYQFVVKNGTEYNLKYNISFVETNNYNINMKYKLKKNDTYLIDHYVSANELIVPEMRINTKNNDTYYLEWKWISSDNDTEIGTTPDVNYNLKINVEAESING